MGLKVDGWVDGWDGYLWELVGIEHLLVLISEIIGKELLLVPVSEIMQKHTLFCLLAASI